MQNAGKAGSSHQLLQQPDSSFCPLAPATPPAIPGGKAPRNAHRATRALQKRRHRTDALRLQSHGGGWGAANTCSASGWSTPQPPKHCLHSGLRTSVRLPTPQIPWVPRPLRRSAQSGVAQWPARACG